MQARNWEHAIIALVFSPDLRVLLRQAEALISSNRIQTFYLTSLIGLELLGMFKTLLDM